MSLKAISLFSGIGGLDYGFTAAGITTAVAVERAKEPAATLAGHLQCPTIIDDLARVSTRTLLRTAGVRKRHVDFLVAGPPCQPFSKAGMWNNAANRGIADNRSETLNEFLRVMSGSLPRAILFENVPGFASRTHKEALELLLGGINRINSRCKVSYNASYAILNAADYGVPQNRERFFLVAFRNGQEFKFPKPTHGEGRAKIRTAWDAIGNIQHGFEKSELAVTGKWAKLLPSIPEGWNYLWHTSECGGLPLFGWRSRYWSFLLKLAKDRPAWTISAQPGGSTGPFHWDNRRLSIEELARLQTFPKKLKLTSSRTNALKMIGNAVPSLLAEVLAREIISQHFEPSTKSSRLKLSIPLQRPIPAATPPKPVPNAYRSLVGRHLPHPGTGRGPSPRLKISQSA